ncbi:MAG TPA: TonB-dependent receptor [Methylophilaceae bacterium]|nr:TonB-dependent receptor [Methylophilaceae bacterium]
MPLQRLLTLEVSSASTYPQKLHDAPASAIIVTAEDIRLHGYRTLAEVLNSMRGLYVTSDRSWSYLGVRGFSRSGDYNSRVLLLVDGMRVNDNIYGQAYIGSEFILDIDLVDQVEFLPGPAASIYGDNAFLGVINVVTKKAGSMLGTTVTGEAGSYQSYKGGVHYGGQFENGAELVVSATALDSEGRDWHYPEFAGKAKGLDGEDYGKLFAKFSYQGLTLEAAHISRDKQNPTAPYGTIFGDTRFVTQDVHTFASATYVTQLADTLEMRLHFNHDIFKYEGRYPYPGTLNLDRSDGRRDTAEARFTSTAFADHRLVGGVEYIRDSRLDQVNYDLTPRVSYVDEKRDADKVGVYLQDEFRLGERWLLNAGIRYDHYDSFGGTANPRLALIYQPSSASSLKFLYGRAFRAPNAYELYYGNDTQAFGQKGNTSLDPETINTYEIAWDQSLNPNWGTHLGIFEYRIHDLIEQQVDPADGLLVFRNMDEAHTTGMEIGLDGHWHQVQLQSSLTYQYAHDGNTGSWLVNSPRVLGKMGLSFPLCSGWRAGSDLLYTSRRRTLAGETGGFVLANVNLSRRDLLPGLDASVGVYNLFDKDYGDPADTSNVQDVIRQDGRLFRVKLDYRF